MQGPAAGQPFNREELVTVGLDSEHRARLHGSTAVHHHDAAAAARRVAADMRAGQAAVFTQEIREQRARLNVALIHRAVDGDLDLHMFTPSRPSAWRSPRATRTPARFFL